MKCDFWASLLAHTFTSPCLGCEPKVKVVTPKEKVKEAKKKGEEVNEEC
jgi:hypothetical protein